LSFFFFFFLGVDGSADCGRIFFFFLSSGSKGPTLGVTAPALRNVKTEEGSTSRKSMPVSGSVMHRSISCA
jgi:hypothetical protein